MKRLTSVAILPVAAIILGAFLPLFNVEACTRMFWNTNGEVMLVGRNLDCDFDDQPVFYVFPKGISKNGGVDVNSASWTSQYGSLVVISTNPSTLNSFDGINTAGLCFHYLTLTSTQYEVRDVTRPGVLQGKFGMYLLDNAATVGEALNLMYQTQLVAEPVAGNIYPWHMALEDASGGSMVVEFIDHQMNVYLGAEYTVLTNDPPFDQQITNLRNYLYFGGDLPLPGDCNPKDRFVRASACLSTLNGSLTAYPAMKTNPVSSMFTAIRSIMEPFGAIQFFGTTPVPGWPTLWTAVSDLTNKAVYFSHNLTRNNFWIDMKKLNFQEGAPIRSLNAERPDLAGEVSRLFTSPAQTSSLWLLLSD